MKRKNNAENHSKIPFIISLSIAGILVTCYFIFPTFHDFLHEAFDVLTSKDEDRIDEWVSQFGIWGPFMLICGMVIQMFMFIVPNILLIIISILSYGPVWGSLIAWLGVVLSSTLGYVIGSRLSPVTVKRLVNARTRRILGKFIRDYGMKAVVVIRLSTLSNDGLSIVAGLLKMQYRRFILSTLMGITPVIVILALFRRSGQIEKGLVSVGVILIFCLVLYIFIDKRRKKGTGV